MAESNSESGNTDNNQSLSELVSGQSREKLRKRAEKLINQTGTDISKLSLEAIQKLITEYQTFQIELTLQNEELAKAYHDLSLSHDCFYQFYDSSSLGYLTLNEDSTILRANPAAQKILDCSEQMLKNKKFSEFVLSADQEAFYFFMQDIASSVLQPLDRTLTIRLSVPQQPDSALQCPGLKLTDCSKESCQQNAPFRYIECRRATRLNNHGSHPFYLTIYDVSDNKIMQDSLLCVKEKLAEKVSKQTEELLQNNMELQHKLVELDRFQVQLMEREAKLNAVFNAAVEGILTVDKAGFIVSVNAAVESIFGYKAEELIGGNLNKLIPEVKRKKHDQLIRTFVPNVIDRIRNVDGLHKDGSIVPLDISIAEFSIDGVHYYASIVRDVSQRQQKELQDKAHLDELAHVTRLGLMGEMASGIAHQVNQPLTAIASYTQACLNFMRAEKPDLRQLGDILQKTHQQALKAGQIIHRMRDFVTFKMIHRSTIAINELINACVDMCETDLKYNNITLTFKLANHLPLVIIDSVQIEQVLINLIRNSIDALKSLDKKKQRLMSVQSAWDDQKGIVVRVKDNGPGIAKQAQEKILTPFYTTKETGMGMGLSICQSIVKAHEGTLSFNSSPEKGTTFYFTLPLKE